MHPALQRQLIHNAIVIDSLSGQLKQFVTSVDETYTHADEDRALIERSLDLSSKELGGLNKELRESKDRLNLVFNTIPEAVSLMEVSKDGTQVRFVLLNKRASEFVGITTEQALGKQLTDMFSKDKAEAEMKKYREVWTTKRIVQCEENLTTLNGKIVVHTILTPIIAQDSTITHILSIAQDITEQKRAADTLKRQEEQLAYAQKIANMGSWQWDVQTEKLSWSDQMYCIFGLTPGEVEPTLSWVKQFFHPDDAQVTNTTLANAIATNAPFQMDHKIIRKDGVIRVIHSEGQPVVDADTTVHTFIGIVQDITERKEAEEKLTERTKELERMNEIMIGRELKMVELKEEIRRMTAQSTQNP